VKAYGAGQVRVIPHVSSVALACARLGWDVAGVDVVSAVGRPLATLRRLLQSGRRVLLLVSESDGAARAAQLLRDSGFGPSRLVVLTQLGGAAERITESTAAEFVATEGGGKVHDPLAIIALDLVAESGVSSLGLTGGLPDNAFLSDGALTKQEVRAVTMAALAPRPGELLWDVGAGSGSIAIEWMRAHPSNTAIAIEPRPDRRDRIAANAERLGVPGIVIIEAEAPHALTGLAQPAAIFIGGGLTDPGVLDACLAALPVGGRLVANGVTIETESLLADCYARLGGRLTRIAISHADRMGTFTTFRPALPITQWVWSR
jgi:precorrin-6B C5,15-methyltransferase / cobalt-precorrin-6B C5,C15-methyltransferase